MVSDLIFQEVLNQRRTQVHRRIFPRHHYNNYCVETVLLLFTSDKTLTHSELDTQDEQSVSLLTSSSAPVEQA